MPLNQRRGAMYTCGTEIGWYLGSRSWRVDRRHWQGPVPQNSWLGSARRTHGARCALSSAGSNGPGADISRRSNGSNSGGSTRWERFGMWRAAARTEGARWSFQPIGGSGTEAGATSTTSLTDRSVPFTGRIGVFPRGNYVGSRRFLTTTRSLADDQPSSASLGTPCLPHLRSFSDGRSGDSCLVRSSVLGSLPCCQPSGATPPRLNWFPTFQSATES